MRQYHLAILITISAHFSFAQAPSWQWANSAGGTGSSSIFANSTATDKHGNIYVVGSFQPGALPFGNTTIYALTDNSFVAKYNSSGNLLWVRTADQQTTQDIAIAYGIAVDDNQNVYVAGSCSGNGLSFGGITLPNNSRTFLVKYDSIGNAIWVKTSVTIDAPAVAKDVAISKDGSIYITGIFLANILSFDGVNITNSTGCIDGFGCADAFIAKYDTSGQVFWVNTIRGQDMESIEGISTDSIGNFYVTGNFESPYAIFNTDTLVNSDSTNFVLGDSSDMFIAKYTPDGNLIWVKGAVGGQDDYAQSIATDKRGNSYVTGYFSSPSISFDTIKLNKVGNLGMYLVKYDSDGKVLYVTSSISTYNYGSSITVDDDSGVYLTGDFGNTVQFDNVILNNIGSTACCVVKYDSSLNALWAIAPTPSSINATSSAKGVSVSPNKEVVVIGGIGCNTIGGSGSSSVAFGSTTLSNQYCMTSGMFFVAKLGSVVGLVDVRNGLNTSLYPNPTSSYLTMDIEANISTQISIYDYRGQLLETINHPHNNTINVSTLSSGIYIAEVKINGHLHRIRWVKM